MSEELSESRFCMWRSVVAMAHADGVVTPHELSFINDYMNDINLSVEQTKIIGEDLVHPQDVCHLFSNITIRQDKVDFFALARALSWCDGDYAAQEKFIIDHLEKVKFDDDNDRSLKESRDVFDEVELSGDQWQFKTERSKTLLGFFDRF